jgi:P2-related tail formation protein
MGMTVYDVRLSDMLPSSFTSDPGAQALCTAFDAMSQIVTQNINDVLVLANIGALPSDVTDELAIEKQVPYYSQSLPLETRQKLLAAAGSLNAKKGSKPAVETIIKAAFESGYVKEWFEYGGQPFHFKAYTDNPNVTTSNLAEFRKALASVQRASAILDEIVLVLSTDAAMQYLAHWLHTGDYITLSKATM